MNEPTIFEFMYEDYKIKKPIRLIEFFAGYGSQALALKYLGVDFTHWKICEWAIKSIQAYKDIHFTNVDNDFSFTFDLDEIKDFLLKKGISSNYNEPMNEKQIKRMSEKQARTIFNNIIATNNLVNIQQVKGKDLDIRDTDKYTYLLTYSFPCQDLSLAGKGKGMSDTSTRSGMLWEVERILSECKEAGTMPEVLLMENVPQVHGTNNVQDFNKWRTRLEELGYKNYFEDLIATDYGIPQTRNRCFMVSVLGDYNYTFPPKQELKLRLKDMLEDNVDEKYFLSDKMIKCFTRDEEGKFPRGERFKQALKQTNENNLAGTITTGAGNRATDNFIITNKSLRETLEQNTKEIKDGSYIDSYNKTIRTDGLSSTITTRVNASNNSYIAIKSATKKGYLEAYEGDGVDISSRMQYHRGTVQKGKTQTLTTMGGENNGVVVGTYQFSKSDNFMKGKSRFHVGKDVSDTILTTPKEGVVTIGNYSPSGHNASRIVDKEYSAPTVMENHGTITATQTSDLRIRKLTPRECFRLMGVKDEDFENCEKNQSDSSLYHLAGDSIVVDVLMAIFKMMLRK